ncbi:hypothetical protein [Citricoccus nitrophenolicus]|uniref:DUF6414 family protein n=1 Tax=Citricoccus nitrophenolicus TaxID=863575 RepID=UPI0039B4C368
MSVPTIVKAPFIAVGRAWRRRRQAQEWKHKRREFVYLDETSVTSLVAARHGSVPESFKDTLSTTNSSDAGTSLTLPSTPAVPGVGMSMRSTSSRTTSQEVVRRAVAQGTFRSLRIGDTDLRVSVEDQPDRPKPAAVSTAAALAHHLPKLEKQHRAVRAQDLIRGDVVEVQVELSPEWSYQFTTAVSSMIDLVEGRAEMFGIEESAVGEVQRVLEMLSRLLVDLVPLQARVTSHRLVVVDDVSWLVDVSMIAGGSELDRDVSEVHLAGVTELPLYWKDVRRVLFAGSAYSVYARLSRSGIQTSWSPVKLADVFDRFLPEVGNQIRELPYLFENARSVAYGVEAPEASEVLRDKGLVPFGRALAQLASRNISGESLLEAATNAARSVATPEELQDVGIVRSAFEEVVTAVENSPSLTEPTEPARIDRNLVRTLRETHHAVARLMFLNELATTGEPETHEEDAPANFLEAEVVAIYW